MSDEASDHQTPREGTLQRLSGSRPTKSEAERSDFLAGLVVLAGMATLLGLGGWWLFQAVSANGSGLLYEVVSAVVVIAILAAALGLLVPLPFFFGSRIVALIALGALVFLAIPAAQSLRTPEQVAAEEAANEKDTDAASEPTYSDTAVKAAAMSRLKESLVDPGSARFRNVRVVVQPSGTKAVCGEVNAKNRTGGYNGFERFVSAGTAELTWLESQVADFEAAWTAVCATE